MQRNGEFGKEVKKRVSGGWRGWRELSGMIRDKGVAVKVKGKVYVRIVRPAILFGLEAVALNKRQETELEVSELKMVGFSLRVTRMERIRNEHIRGTVQVRCFGDNVREARLRWFGHEEECEGC